MKVVIIGAGLSGRGYLARQFLKDGWEITFLDKNQKLITDLKRKKGVQIRFFGSEKKVVEITHYHAYKIGSSQGNEAIRNADFILTCVGEQNVKQVAETIAAVLREDQRKYILAAENGVEAIKILSQKLPECCVGGCLMLCTTMPDGDSLDIISEELDYLPYTWKGVDQKSYATLPESFVPCARFQELQERKLYTYNTLSAAIAYLGYIKGFEDYGKAARDPHILQLTDVLAEKLDRVLSEKYQIDIEEQKRLSMAAKSKFRNPEILDSIARNARDAERKLRPSERILGPLCIMREQGADTEEMEQIMAAAVVYGENMGEWENGKRKIQLALKEAGLGNDKDMEKRILQKYVKMIEK